MKPLTKNFRDVGASLSCIAGCPHQQQQQVEHNTLLQQYSNLTLPPGFILRSSAWDTQPEIRWKDLGRPKTILNLRENCETGSYDQLMVDDDDDAANTSHNRCVPNVWRISAENNIEKYDLSLTGSRDWLISVLQRLLRDDDVDGCADYEGLSLLNDDADNNDDECLLKISSLPVQTTSKDSNTTTFAKPNSVVDVISNNSNDNDGNDHDEERPSNNSLTNFRIALGIALRQKISKNHAPLLVHCRFGRDRTGIVVAFLLKLLLPSLPESILLQEFLLSDLNEDVVAMQDKGKMFTDLTLRNLPSVYEYIESRKKMIFRGDEYKATRMMLSRITKRLESLNTISPSIPSLVPFPQLTTIIGFSIDDDYLKSEAGRYFKKAKRLLSSSSSLSNICGTVDINEQHHIIWASFAFYHCALIWSKIRFDVNRGEHNKKDEEEKDDTFNKIEDYLYQLHLCSITTQLAWTILNQGINISYPLPPILDDLMKVQKVHKQLQCEVYQLEATISSVDNCPSFLVERVKVLKKRIK